jgi:hypothetical protein
MLLATQTRACASRHADRSTPGHRCCADAAMRFLALAQVVAVDAGPAG